MKIKNLILSIILMFALAAQSGCAWFQRGPDPLEDTPQELAQAGVDAMEQERYKKAIEHFSDLRDRFPFSPHTPRAEIALGDAYMKSGNYVAAITVFTEFAEMNPRHEMIPYVLFRTGLAYYNKFTSIDRPQRNMQQALEYFRRVVQVYPETEYAEYSRYYKKQCRIKMAEHELYIADFYWRTKRYGSAYERYRYVEQNFEDLPKIVEYARERAKTSYFKHQEHASRHKRATDEGSWRDWLDWL
ncbi:outer membrane protein assembly factor BamD [Desulfonatronospira sp.]|uniref:outer membrane protein assembly factor BamD n=1 Tax=Desulfonatronospira sp. TaxID=1962951 RepID=UPI0025BD9813|nr:outer membrane protein assembly factor BamD [Desulfonatronospira sp.]